MKKTRLLSLALAGFCFTSIRVSYAATIVEDFAKDPLETGWQVFGDASHFQRDAVNEHLAVTWDSSRPNSYFYVPLGTMLSRNTDFSFAFDLHLTDAISGNEPGKTGGMQLAIGLLNLAGATSPAFMRGAFGNAPNVVEFDYFPAGFYEGFGDVSATTTPTFISGSGFAFAPTLFGSYLLELPADQWMRVALTYTAADQKLVFTVTADGVPLAEFPEIVLDSGENSAFESTDDFQVDAFSISSYGSAGNDFDSVLAHGWVDNVVITVPSPPIQNLEGRFSNNVWQVQFDGLRNWRYSLERTTDFAEWGEISDSVASTDGPLTLQDANPPTGYASYRVRAEQP